MGYQLKRAQHGLRLALDAALRPIGLTTPQYAVLEALGQAAGLSGADLARRAFVTPQTMNAIVVTMERAGLLARRPHPTHGRVLQAHLTAAGERCLRSARKATLDIEEEMLSSLEPAERAHLATLLGGCADRLEPQSAASRLHSSPALAAKNER